MINSLKSFATVLELTSLRDRNIAQVDVLDGNETVFAVDVSGEDVLSVWNVGRILLDKTGRWPVISTFWTKDGDGWKEKVEEADFFSRFYFEEAPNISDVSPQGLIKLAETADLNFLLNELSNQNNEYLTIDDVLDFEIQDSFFRYGEKPTEEQIKQAKIHGKPIETARDLDY